MTLKTFLIFVGSRIVVPTNFPLMHIYEPAGDPVKPGHKPMVLRMVLVEIGRHGPLYGFQLKPSDGRKPPPSLVVFADADLVSGDILLIERVHRRYACVRRVPPI